MKFGRLMPVPTNLVICTNFVGMTPEQHREIWHLFNRFQKSREAYYGPKINKALKNQVQQFINAKEQGFDDYSALNRINSAKLYKLLKELYLDAGITFGAKHLTYLKRQKARLPIGFNQLLTDLMNNYFLTELLNTVENITSYTRDKIRDIMIAAYATGKSFTEITNELTATGFTQSRARLIARTETVTAANQGSMFSVKTTGLKLNKIWISSQDNRTRRRPRDKHDHLTMNGKLVGYNDPFYVDGEIMYQPGDRKHGATAGNICNCRCAVGFEPVRENGKLVYEEQLQAARFI